MRMPILLVVDDEPTNLAVLANLLRPSYTVRACKSGEQALASALREPRPDLILLDVMMPDMDGFAVLAHLRQDPRTRDIPVIFVTALSDEVDEEYGLRLGAVDYITKPIKPAVVLSRIQVHVEVKQARDRLQDHNAWLEAEVARRMSENLLIQDVSLAAMAQLAETRDGELGNHIARTQAYMDTLARQLQPHPRFAQDLEESQLRRIVKAAPLHDIGKIGIPDHILLKPGPFTADEWAIMQTHCRIGGQAIDRAMRNTLQRSADTPGLTKPESLRFLDVAKEIATFHHEKWDGSGYPHGLAGEVIPVSARLMALADVFDALTTPRVYKKSWTIDEAVALIREQSGRHFDPDIVTAFETVLDTFVTIQQRLADQPFEE